MSFGTRWYYTGLRNE